jgi:GNAT superfamily N-acetyltransferase
MNSVLYDDAGALDRHYDRLAHAYDEAGIEAWTVWVHPGDARAARLLEDRGHVLDAQPSAMALELDGFAGTTPGFDWRPARDGRDFGELNDRAYGYSDAPFTRAFGDEPPAPHTYIAEVDGEPAACVGAVDAEGDCCIVWVATAEQARGRGLASGLMTQALLDARERGCQTSSLQATAMGEPVYARLGYRRLGTLEMWERRRP